MAITWGELKARIASRSHKDLGRSEELDDVERFAKAGIELVEAEDSWSWLYKAFSISLVAGTYEYDWPTGLERFDVKTFRYAGSGSYLEYARIAENIDHHLGPDWRDAGSATSDPRYYVDFGRKFWIAPKPSSGFVSSNSTIHLYGYTSDLATLSGTPTDATEMLLPERSANTFVEAALMVGLQQEDDPDWKTYQQIFQSNIIRLRTFDASVASTDEVLLPEWSPYMEF